MSKATNEQEAHTIYQAANTEKSCRMKLQNFVLVWMQSEKLERRKKLKMLHA